MMEITTCIASGHMGGRLKRFALYPPTDGGGLYINIYKPFSALATKYAGLSGHAKTYAR